MLRGRWGIKMGGGWLCFYLGKGFLFYYIYLRGCFVFGVICEWGEIYVNMCFKDFEKVEKGGRIF